MSPVLFGNDHFAQEAALPTTIPSCKGHYCSTHTEILGSTQPSWFMEGRINPHFPSSHVRAELEALSSCQSRLSVRGSPFQPPITDLIQVQLILCIRGCVTEQKCYHIADKYSEELPPSKEQGNNKQPRWVLVTFGKFAFPESSPFQSTSLTLKAIV